MIETLQVISAAAERPSGEDIFDCFARSLRRRHGLMWPFAHAFLERVLPQRTVQDVANLSWPAADLQGVSGRRELHNEQRRYFDAEALSHIDVAFDLAETFQGRSMIRLLRNELGIDLSGTYLRIEYCQDVEGFWLEPHTDIGVKRLTLQIYLSGGLQQQDLGTDIYSDATTRVARTPFGRNRGMLFIPNERSWHGFEQRPIHGVRKSLILNYVTSEWRANEQLAFPDEPVSAL
jgi:hypothetical protein